MQHCVLSCPAYAASSDEQIAAALQRIGPICQQLGWELKASPLLADPQGPGVWLPVERRAADWRTSCDTAQAIWALRGGYGAIELALALGPDGPQPPQLIGYSDITALHALRFGQGLGGCYGPIAGQAFPERSSASLIAALSGEEQSWEHHKVSQVISLHDGDGSGPCFAACLRVLTALVGTPLMPDLTGCILVVEDIDERPYAVARDLLQLLAAGCLDGIRGIVGSSFPHDPIPDYAGPDHGDVIADLAAGLGIPALWRFPCGHDDEPLSLRQAVPTELQVAGASWSLQQASV
ncbi:MAG: LD-carboxypeptidase [Planctomycetota bacterium]|jgi:muramoyltetrapeptide carboxypeptidase|nr:LD-carboxypeptidase [Planctomycetota bacterium]